MQTVESILTQIAADIEKILLKELSKDRTELLMDDINHVIFSHAQSELDAVCIALPGKKL